ncbi:hypothetical protein GQ54DRAFT_298645 [Martensiomyces pterosporus]|nr:hypothetical protein GQ54DRAFT_298645 [Martensiomyces pterosporus]
MLIAQLPDDLTDDEEVRWIERLCQQLQGSHNAKCPWKGHACTESIYSVPLATSKEAVDDVCQNAVALLVFKQQLPRAAHPLSTFQQGLLRDLQSKAKALYRNPHTSEEMPDDCDVESALVLALFGWRVDSSMPRPAVKCELCFRSAGLWLFQNAHGSGAGDAGPGVDGRKSEGRSSAGTDTRAFNALDEHRAFCYWAHGSDAVAAAGGVSDARTLPARTLSANTIPGWQKTVASILRAKTMDSGPDEGGDGATGSVQRSNSPSTASCLRASEAAHAASQLSATSDSSVLSKFKPFNISAISSAAEAFGIPFSMSLLADATRRLSSLVSAHHTHEGAATSAVGAPATIDGSSTAISGDDSILLTENIEDNVGLEYAGGQLPSGAGSDWDSDVANGLRVHTDEEAAPPESTESDIPEPIDTSGIASLLGDSSLASALEDPAKAQAILEYVKGLLKAKNQAPTA